VRRGSGWPKLWADWLGAGWGDWLLGSAWWVACKTNTCLRMMLWGLWPFRPGLRSPSKAFISGLFLLQKWAVTPENRVAPRGEMYVSPSVARTRSLSWASAAGFAVPFTSTAALWSCYESSWSAHGHTVLPGISFSG